MIPADLHFAPDRARVDGAEKTTHSVFSVSTEEILPLIDQAWLQRGLPLAKDPRAYLVYMDRVIGTAGEKWIKIIVEAGTSNVVTAYPIVP